MAKEKLEKKSQAESLEPIDQLRQSFVEIEKKRKKLIKEEFSDIDGLKEVVEDQSLEALEALVGDVERLASHKALKGKDKVIVKEIANRIQLIDNNRIDARVGMYKKDYAKIFVKKAIQEEIVKPDADLGRIARLSLDVNGLKAVNDLNGGNHTPGDEYLDLAANVIKSEKVLAWGKENNIKIAFSKDGGDEYGVILVGENAITKDQLRAIENIIQEAIEDEETLKRSEKLLDFNNETVQRCFAGMTEQAWNSLGQDEKNITINESGIAKDFRFPLRISMGSVNLAEAIEMSKETKDVINLNDSAEVRVNRTMGALFGVSDKEMGNNKKLFKEKLNKSNDSTERSLALIYSRTDSEREAMKRMKEINDEIAQKVKELENVKQVLMEHVENVAFLEEHTDDTHRLLESTLKENRALSAENAQLKEKVINIQTELNGCETKLARQNIQDMAQ